MNKRLKAVVLRGEHLSCTQTEPLTSACGVFAEDVDFTYWDCPRQFHKEHEEMYLDEIVDGIASYDFGLIGTHLHQVYLLEH